jgi:serine protease Do
VKVWGTLLLLVAVGHGVASAAATEPLASFVVVAAAARAASIVIQDPDERGIARPVQVSSPLEEGELGVLSARRARTRGVGVIVDPHGFALTSARIVSRMPGFEVALVDGTALKATVVGVDRQTDVAVLKLESDRPLPHLPLGDSDRVEVGDWVIAVSAPYGLEGTVSAGIITAKPSPESSSPLASFLQTDVAMGLGNRGGPIVAMSGEVVAIGTAITGDGVGYALPARTVRKVYLELMEKGRVSRPWLGATTQSLTADLARALGVRVEAGALVADVLPQSPAARAGLRSGDIVVEVGGRPVSSRAHVEQAISRLAPGEIVRLKVHRYGRELVTPVKLAEEPDDWEVVPALARAKRLLGLDIRPITPTMGAMVADVDPEGPAELAGIEPGDVLREVDHQPVRDITDFQAIVRRLRADAEVLLLVQRADVALYVVLRARE